MCNVFENFQVHGSEDIERKIRQRSWSVVVVNVIDVLRGVVRCCVVKNVIFCCMKHC